MAAVLKQKVNPSKVSFPAEGHFKSYEKVAEETVLELLKPFPEEQEVDAKTSSIPAGRTSVHGAEAHSKDAKSSRSCKAKILGPGAETSRERHFQYH